MRVIRGMEGCGKDVQCVALLLLLRAAVGFFFVEAKLWTSTMTASPKGTLYLRGYGFDLECDEAMEFIGSKGQQRRC